MAQSPRQPGKSYRSRYDDHGPPRPPPDAKNAMYHFQGTARDREPAGYRNRPARNSGRPSRPSRPNNSNNPHNPNPGQRFNFRAPIRISERPLLRQRHDSREDHVLTSNGKQDRFRDVENMTDSEEEDMEDSDDDVAHARAKRIKLDPQTSELPKWSNPDPYTSLPAPNETTGKKIDVVKLIRKARNDQDKDDADANAKAQDFISLSFGDDEGRVLVGSDTATMQHRLPPTGPASMLAAATASETIVQSPFDSTATKAPLYFEDEVVQTLGKRKRQEERAAVVKVRLVRIRGQDSHYNNGMVLDRWMATGNRDSTPWLRATDESSAAIALHREILDFYEWVRPQDYEFDVRGDCIARLSATFRRFQIGELRAFGSYGAGLFLPTGDMDLVFLEAPFLSRLRRGERGVAAPLSNTKFKNWLSFIRNAGVAKPGTIVPILHAKVPLIKFIELKSGLKIDLSFNNDTGLVANETFAKWKAQYPSMPIIVSIIKQFLMIRGLNDVSTGGLGGFSTICLATSLIQHLPSSGRSQNLGECLLQFFNLYGNHLDRDTVAIRLDPPGYVDKVGANVLGGCGVLTHVQASYGPQLFTNDKKGRLTIIDPHRPDNNISGGTSEIKLIMQNFSDAYDTLRDRLVAYDGRHGRHSFLDDLIGGDFDAYRVQRNILYSLHIGRPGSSAPATRAASPVPPPPLAPAPVESAPPPPPDAASNHRRAVSDNNENDNDNDNDVDKDLRSRSSTNSAAESRHLMTPGEKRARRFKKLRPDVAVKVGTTLKKSEAIKMGGYANSQQMVDDLIKKENLLQKTGPRPAQKRATRLRTLRPDVATRIGREISVSEAVKIGGYRNTEEMTKDLSRRETTGS